MTYISVPIDPSLNIAEVNEVLETDPVLASFINGYFQRFLSNDQALKNMINKKPSTADLAKVASSGSYNDLSDKPDSIGSAEKLINPRNFQTNLSSTKPASFDGSADNSHGVTGILGTENGGTGNSKGTMDSDKINFNDGKTAEEKLGAIDGITDDPNSENSRIAASSKALKKVNDSLKANGNQIYMDYHDGKYGVNTSPTRGADTFFPFSNTPKTMTVYGVAANVTLDVSPYNKVSISYTTPNTYVYSSISLDGVVYWSLPSSQDLNASGSFEIDLKGKSTMNIVNQFEYSRYSGTGRTFNLIFD